MANEGFPGTHWASLIALGNPADSHHLEHLDRLLRRYWKPVYFYVRAMRRVSPEDAEDLTQGFFTMVLERVDFAQLSPERGSFRGFLKTALRRFVVSQERTLGARARQKTLSFPFAEAESLWRRDQPAAPEEAFDRAWAREVLNEAVGRLERELGAEGKQLHFRLFHRYCLDPAGDATYDSLAQEHGLKPDDVGNYLRLVRQRARDIVKSLLKDYLFPGESIEDELRFMLGP